jgi:hypothetical protein
MSGQITSYPHYWNVYGNIAPLELSQPTDKQFFIQYKCQIELQNEININNMPIKPIKLIPDIG